MDLIERQAAIDAVAEGLKRTFIEYKDVAEKLLNEVPSAQPERTCVNCGRTANNGGWYADGKTRCPIEEYYALPKDGYCHLWEKRNVTDDDYPERQKHRMCADIYGDWFCADAERRQDGDKRKEDANRD